MSALVKTSILRILLSHIIHTLVVMCPMSIGRSKVACMVVHIKKLKSVVSSLSTVMNAILLLFVNKHPIQENVTVVNPSSSPCKSRLPESNMLKRQRFSANVFGTTFFSAAFAHPLLTPKSPSGRALCFAAHRAPHQLSALPVSLPGRAPATAPQSVQRCKRSPY